MHWTRRLRYKSVIPFRVRTVLPGEYKIMRHPVKRVMLRDETRAVPELIQGSVSSHKDGSGEFPGILNTENGGKT